MSIHFEWDPEKEGTNIRKHGLDFSTAAAVFADPLALTAPDEYVGQEHRWQTTGHVQSLLLIVVTHLLWEEDYNGSRREVVRIISARAADRKERRNHEQKRSQF